ncbi:MAG: hypothetical protein BWY62_01450 [Firmicutes bacterium ADurb.Bin356]|nr:MAG: hypothetical protein BWY62_01450 [Firmicutes bacterium ADurb.Bin356]
MDADATNSFTTLAAATPSDDPTYIFRTLTDSATGVIVSGIIHTQAQLVVGLLTLHNDPACDTIRRAQADGRLICGFDISLSRSFIAPLTVSIPISSKYDGQFVTILHCINGRLEAITVKVANGMARFDVSELSPFAVVRGMYAPKQKVTSPPKTGDSIILTGFLLLVLSVLCSIHLMRRRRAQQNCRISK